MTVTFLKKHQMELIPQNFRDLLTSKGILPISEEYDPDNIIVQGSVNFELNENKELDVKFNLTGTVPLQSCNWLFDGESIKLVYEIYN